MLKLRSRPKLFYGWWMALSGVGILFYTSGVFFYGFSPFFDEIILEANLDFAPLLLDALVFFFPGLVLLDLPFLF